MSLGFWRRPWPVCGKYPLFTGHRQTREEGVYEMYTETVMDHFSNPRNVGEIRDADGVGEAGNPVCGDIMKIYVKIKNERIVDIKFKTFGCVAAIATTSILTEMVKGKTIAEA